MILNKLKLIASVSLDFYNNNIKTINVKQCDTNSRFVHVSFTEHGKKVALNQSTMSVIARYKKPDCKFGLRDCEILEDGSVLIELTEQMTVVSGKTQLDVMILETSGVKANSFADANSFDELGVAILSTMPLHLNVMATPVQGAELESKYDFTAFNESLATVKSAESDMIAKNQEWAQAEKDRVEAEKEREQNVTNLINNCQSDVNEVIQEFQTKTKNITKECEDKVDSAIQECETKANAAIENACENVVVTLGIVKQSEKGVAGGVASLDETGKVPKSQLPALSDWEQDNSASTDYIKNKPMIKTGIGENSVILNDCTHNNAKGSYSTAEGYLTTAGSLGSHAEGAGAKANAYASHAEGDSTTAMSSASHAEGMLTTARGVASHAEGESTSATGYASHAEGTGTTAEERNSHAEGSNTTASGSASHAEGGSTTASGGNSHAEGAITEAIGHGSHAEGYVTKAIADYSHAEGWRTQTSYVYSHVQGLWNIIDANSKFLHIVGNGNPSARSNAHTIDLDGNGWFKGSITSNGEDYAEYFEWLDGNLDNEDRVGLIVTLDGDKIKPANAGDEVLGIISGTVAVLGGNYECEWNGKYLTDDFGRIIYDMVEEFIDVEKVTYNEVEKEIVDEETNETRTKIVTEEVVTVEKKSLGYFKRPKINPDYDSTQKYINRSERPEWSAVGMLGKLYVRDDGTCEVNGYVTVGENGVVTASSEKTNMRVLSRVNENIVRVLLK